MKSLLSSESFEKNNDWLVEVSKYLPVYSKLRLLSCCKGAFGWNEGWHDLYNHRFGTHATVFVPNAHAFLGYSLYAVPRKRNRHCWRQAHLRRIETPECGDIVEVCWNGKFNGSIGNGDSCSVDNGASWWTALVVGRSPDGFYKVTFPGWSPIWDETVHRHQCRWPTQLDHPRIRDHRLNIFQKHDFVEICFWPDTWPMNETSGLPIQLRRPPVWLEASVLQVKQNKQNETYVKVRPTIGGFFLFSDSIHDTSSNSSSSPNQKKIPKNKPFWVRSTKVVHARSDPLYQSYQFNGYYKHVFLTIDRKGSIIQYSPTERSNNLAHSSHQVQFKSSLYDTSTLSKRRRRRALKVFVRRIRCTLQNKKHQACASLVPVSSTTPFESSSLLQSPVYAF
uniref:Uncharacterized protein n=1 Tax=Aureoumbra lagunensis TaxID=44058 RepID=A0A7S3NPD3_9STRA